MTDSVTAEQDTSGGVKQLDREDFQRLLMGLTPEEFEYFVADVWDELRPGTPEVTQLSGDMGVDVSITDGLEREMIQVKRYHRDNTVGRPEIQQYYALYDQENADRVTVVTSGTFTENAESWAVTHGVTLFDYNDLYDLFDEADLSDLLSEWFIEGVEIGGSPFPSLGRLVAPITGLPALITRLGRPLWAVTAVLGMGVLVVAGAVELLAEVAPGVAARSESSTTTPLWFSVVTVLCVFVSPLVFSLGLAVQRRWWRSLLSFGGFVASIAMFVLGAASRTALDSAGLVLASLIPVALACEDMYRLVRTGVRAHYRDAVRTYLDRFRSDETDGTDEDDRTPVVNPLEYATVAARKQAEPGR